MEKKRKISKPGLRKRKLPEVIESLIWDTKKGQELPPLGYNDCWYLNTVYGDLGSLTYLLCGTPSMELYILYLAMSQCYQPRLDQWIEN